MMPRRRFNKISALGLSGLLISPFYKRTLADQVNQEKLTYENHMKGIRIFHIDTDRQEFNISLSSLNPGHYLIRIIGNDGSGEIFRFVKKE